MAWNGSDKEKVEVEGQGQERKEKLRSSTSTAQFNYKALVAGLIVVIGGGLAAWMMMRGKTGEKVVKVERKPSQIAEVKPQVVTNAASETEAAEVIKPKPIDPNARPTKVGEVVNGYVKLPSGRIHRRVGVITNSVAKSMKPKYAIFERRCNNNIAGLLMARPGDAMVGTPRYNGRFAQDFVESLKEPLYVASDDPPEVAQLKRDVIAARIELKDAMDRGEDIEQIMLDTRKELQDLARVKQMYRKTFMEEFKKCETDHDVDVLIESCNKMLEEKGIAPLTCGPITRRNILRAQQEEQMRATETTNPTEK